MSIKERAVLFVFSAAMILIVYFVLVETGIVNISKYSSPSETSRYENIDTVPHQKSSVNKNTETSKYVAIHISGAVRNQGLYRLPPDARLGDLIELSGGVYDTADLKVLNLAMKLDDGSKIVIPEISNQNNMPDISKDNIITNKDIQHYIAHKDEENLLIRKKIEDISRTNSSLPQLTSGKININTANKEELDRLPNIGLSTATRIINYRETHGPFKRIEDIQNVSRIGPKIFETIKPEITVD